MNWLRLFLTQRSRAEYNLQHEKNGDLQTKVLRNCFDMEHTSYKLGPVSVTITPTKTEGRYEVRCQEGETVSTFTASEYELTHYRRHMNTKITQAFKAHRESAGSSDSKETPSGESPKEG